MPPGQGQSEKRQGQDRGIDWGANLEPMTLEEFYRLERGLGATIVDVEGVGWRQVRPGFWRPAFPFTTIQRGRARAPKTSWLGGYQHAVEDWRAANSTIQLIIWDQMGEYELTKSPKQFRQGVHRAMEWFAVRDISNVGYFVDHAWPVYCSFQQRTLYHWRDDRLRRERFASWAEALFSAGKVKVLGAFSEGRLVGVDSIYRVQDVAIGGPTFCHSDALRHRVSDLLLHTLYCITAESEGVKCLYLGGVSRKASLNAFKLKRGAKIVSVAAYCRLYPWAYCALRILCPGALARMGWGRISFTSRLEEVPKDPASA